MKRPGIDLPNKCARKKIRDAAAAAEAAAEAAEVERVRDHEVDH